MRNITPFSQQYFQEDKEGAKDNRTHYLEEAAAKDNRNNPQHRYHKQPDSTSTESLSPKLPIRDQEVATSANNSSEDEDAHQLKNVPFKMRMICLITVFFALLTVTVGILQYKHSMQEDNNENRESDYITGIFPGSIILRSGESLLPGDFVASPSGDFRVRMADRGDLVLEDMRLNTTIWSAGVVGGVVCDMQDDGNVIIRNQLDESLWSTGTHKHDSSTLIVDDGGRIGVRYSETLVWMQGIPGAQYTGPSSNDLIFPVRGAFYYSWYPQTWKVSSGDLARFEPDLGYYLSGDPVVVESHIDQFEYGNIDLGIISWFGPGSNLDIARITELLDKTFDRKSQLKWTVYYEDEWKLDPSHSLLKADLEYLKKWFAWHPAWAIVNGKPLIYIWNESDCEVVQRWMEASNGEWYVIPKLFSNFEDCPIQPDSWHQYGPASPFSRFKGNSISISPGFWHAAEPTPRLPRLSESEWCENVRKMVDSGEPWQLITTFNEAGEGTGIEATSGHWPSESGYGYYLDCLHLIA